MSAQPRGCWWIGSNGINSDAPVTMMTVQTVRAWAEKALGATASTFVMERIGDRNRVAIRFILPDGIGEVEVAVLKELHRFRNRNAQIRERLREALGFQ
jgi:hypothetical protein